MRKNVPEQVLYKEYQYQNTFKYTNKYCTVQLYRHKNKYQNTNKYRIKD